MATSRVWYVAYGSNVNEERLRSYLPEDETDARYTAGMESRWVQLDHHRLYFAGRSKTWGGAVAFCSLAQQPARPYCGRAYALTSGDLALVLAKENGRAAIGWDLADVNIEVGEWVALPVAFALDGFGGKYNALLRLTDIDGDPSYTLTTSRVLPMGPPTAEYLDTIVAGLAASVGEGNARALLADAAASVVKTNLGFVDFGATRTVTWSGTAKSGRSTGLPTVRLPTTASGGCDQPSLQLGTLRAVDRQISVWVSYSLADGETAEIGPALARTIGGDAQPIQVLSALPVEPRRIPGYVADLPSPDVIHVDDQLAGQLGGWALALTPQLSAPVRVVARPHVPLGAVRTAYGVRILLGLGPDDRLQLTPLPSTPELPGRLVSSARLRWRRVRRTLVLATRGVGEALLGAPTVTLRATEGLVGDDGRPVVRVDSTALDYLGLAAGDQALLTWATRVTRVRVLLQTDETRQRMDEQLAERTGDQFRAPLADPNSRIKVPSHLRVWVSPTVRQRIKMPPDTLVRLRRRLPHVLGRNAAALVVPFAAWQLPR